jgi:hypothetical protein
MFHVEHSNRGVTLIKKKNRIKGLLKGKNHTPVLVFAFIHLFAF